MSGPMKQSNSCPKSPKKKLVRYAHHPSGTVREKQAKIDETMVSRIKTKTASRLDGSSVLQRNYLANPITRTQIITCRRSSVGGCEEDIQGPVSFGDEVAEPLLLVSIARGDVVVFLLKYRYPPLQLSYFILQCGHIGVRRGGVTGDGSAWLQAGCVFFAISSKICYQKICYQKICYQKICRKNARLCGCAEFLRHSI